MNTRLGLALTEFILAITIAALVFVASLSLLPTLWMSQTQNLHRLEAGTLAQSILAQQGHRPFGQLVAITQVSLPGFKLADEVPVECSLQVWPVVGNPDVIRLRVTLTWPEGRRSATLFRETMVTVVNR